jgi:diketogulonate reductase-like aldo/keto reductase
MYGTAWKEERTQGLVRLALEAGFRAIDTANQRRHYFEEGVGAALAESGIAREELFLQTKFTFAGGHDHRIPYDLKADPATQVRQSFESSLVHLRTDYVDSYVLHGPSRRSGLGADDWAVWRAMEELCRAQQARVLGVSNVTLEQLVALEAGASEKPAFVQNRCYASTGWDREVRAFCSERGIVYQGFSLLTANRRELGGRVVREIAARIGRTPEQVVFRFAIEVGMLPLTGTSSAEHMRQDLASLEFELAAADVRAIEAVSY